MEQIDKDDSLYQLYRDRIQNEYDLVDHRLTWPWLGLGSLVVGLAAYDSLDQKNASPCLWALGFFIISIIFLAQSLSVWAAIYEIRRLKIEFKDKSENLEGDRLLNEARISLLTSSKKTHFLGNVLIFTLTILSPITSFALCILFALGRG